MRLAKGSTCYLVTCIHVYTTTQRYQQPNRVVMRLATTQRCQQPNRVAMRLAKGSSHETSYNTAYQQPNRVAMRLATTQRINSLSSHET